MVRRLPSALVNQGSSAIFTKPDQETVDLPYLQRPSLPQPPPIEPGGHSLFGDIAAPAKPAAKPKAGSRPVYKFEMPDGAPYALAGLFSEWQPRRGDSRPPLDTFSIVTTEANEITATYSRPY